MGRAGSKNGTNGHAAELQRWCIQTGEGRVFLVYTASSKLAVDMVIAEGFGHVVSCVAVDSVEQTFKLHPLPDDYWEAHVRKTSQGRKRR